MGLGEGPRKKFDSYPEERGQGMGKGGDRETNKEAPAASRWVMMGAWNGWVAVGGDEATDLEEVEGG